MPLSNAVLLLINLGNDIPFEYLVNTIAKLSKGCTPNIVPGKLVLYVFPGSVSILKVESSSLAITFILVILKAASEGNLVGVKSLFIFIGDITCCFFCIVLSIYF